MAALHGDRVAHHFVELNLDQGNRILLAVLICFSRWGMLYAAPDFAKSARYAVFLSSKNAFQTSSPMGSLEHMKRPVAENRL